MHHVICLKKNFTCGVANGHVTNGYKFCKTVGFFFSFFLLLTLMIFFFNGYNFYLFILFYVIQVKITM